MRGATIAVDVVLLRVVRDFGFVFSEPAMAVMLVKKLGWPSAKISLEGTPESPPQVLGRFVH
ncbi:MAG: hypothetical protein U0792_05270 [Gemmataceae bacterium]